MSTSAPARVSVRDLAKSYGPVAAVRGISFDVAPGEILGLLGPNGAGKTTAIECLLGLRQPDAGSIRIAGIDARADPAEAARHVGAQLQFAALQDKITPREALELFASFYRDAAAPAELLAQFQLTAQADARFDTLSGGQRQRLFLALALVNRPDVVVLDEPTAGLDPAARRELHQLIAALGDAGRSVLLCTHQLGEAEALCDRVAILHEGRLIATASPADLIAQARATPRIFFRATRSLEPARFAAVGALAAHGDGWRFAVEGGVNRAIAELTRLVAAHENELLDLRVEQPTLEDVFLELTGRPWEASDGEANR